MYSSFRLEMYRHKMYQNITIFQNNHVYPNEAITCGQTLTNSYGAKTMTYIDN